MLHPTNIRSMWETLQKRIGAVQVEASCKDSIERTFASLDDLLLYENPRSRAIVRLTFSAHSEDRESRIKIRFGGRYGSSIEASMTGPEESVIRIKNELGEIFDGVRPWFASLARIDFTYVVGGAFVFWVIVLQIMVGDYKVSVPKRVIAAISAAAAITAFCAALIATIWGLNRLRQRYFPIATFALGQGEARYAVDEKIRWVVIVGFLVSMFASLVTAYLLR